MQLDTTVVFSLCVLEELTSDWSVVPAREAIRMSSQSGCSSRICHPDASLLPAFPEEHGRPAMQSLIPHHSAVR